MISSNVKWKVYWYSLLVIVTGENKHQALTKDSRRKFLNLEKVRALDLDKGMFAVDVASKYNVNKSIINRWKNTEMMSFTMPLQAIERNRKGGKHTKLLTLFEKFKSARSQDKRCSHVWIYILKHQSCSRKCIPIQQNHCRSLLWPILLQNIT